MIKKTLSFLFIAGFFFAGYIILSSKINLFKNEKTVITTEMKQVNEYVKKHEKKLNQVFEVDSIKYIIQSFEYLKQSEDDFLLKVIIDIENITNHHKSKDEDDLYLKTYSNNLNKLFYPKYNLPSLLPHQKKQEIVYFNVQKTSSRSIGYALNIKSKQNPHQNALIFLNVDLAR